MPAYDFKCNNPECEYDGFTIIASMKDVQRSYPCTICGKVSSTRIYQPILHKWNFKNAQEVRGVLKAEESMEKAYKEANAIADNVYEARAEQGTKKWVQSGGRDQLVQEIVDQNFKPDRTYVHVPKKIAPPKK